MSHTFFSVYIRDEPVVVSAMIPLLYIPIATPIEFLIVAITSVPVCFICLGGFDPKDPIC
jgi:hypothetical protein